ncbi:MAG: hypothetical protein J7L47_06015 [Candidatus Odinarchaeota archaeon]|nr:hypothetical protein [Candidatus Odinarchaeota archaeon]
MVEEVEVVDAELYDLGFEVGLSEICPYRTSCYYYSATLSPDERHIAFYIMRDRKKGEKHNKVAIWNIEKKEVVNIFEITSEVSKIGPSVYKIEFMSSRNYIAVLCRRAGRFENSIQIYNLDGELIKEIEFPVCIKHGWLFYEPMFNFAVSPDSKKIAISMQTRKVHKKGDTDIPVIPDEVLLRGGGPPVPHARLIYGWDSDEIINLITEEDLGCFFSGQLRWPVDNGIVTSTIIPPALQKKRHKFSIRGESKRPYRPMTYATLINPYTGEVISRTPVRYSNSIVQTYEARLYTASGTGYSGDAYFVRPGGEYIAIVNKYVDIARFSDFDPEGRFIGKGEKWRTVKEFRAHADNIEWSPNTTELIYQYRKSFVTLDYEKNEVTRHIVPNLKSFSAVRIFWLRDNTIIFLNGKDLGRSVGILRL